MFRTKTSRSLVLFSTSAVIGIGSLWKATGNFKTSVLFYVVSSGILGGALFAFSAANDWISRGEDHSPTWAEINEQCKSAAKSEDFSGVIVGEGLTPHPNWTAANERRKKERK